MRWGTTLIGIAAASCLGVALAGVAGTECYICDVSDADCVPFHASEIPGILLVGHNVHPACLEEFWMASGMQRPVCPLCRQPRDSTTPLQKIQHFAGTDSAYCSSPAFLQHLEGCTPTSFAAALKLCGAEAATFRFSAAVLGAFGPLDSARALILAAALPFKDPESQSPITPEEFGIFLALHGAAESLRYAASVLVHEERHVVPRKDLLSALLACGPLAEVFRGIPAFFASSEITAGIRSKERSNAFLGALKMMQKEHFEAAKCYADPSTCFASDDTFVLFVKHYVGSLAPTQQLACLGFFTRRQRRSDAFYAELVAHLGRAVAESLVGALAADHQQHCPRGMKRPRKLARCRETEAVVRQLVAVLPPSGRNAAIIQRLDKRALK